MNRNPIHDFSPLGAFWRRLIPVIIVSMVLGFGVATCAGTLDVSSSAGRVPLDVVRSAASCVAGEGIR